MHYKWETSEHFFIYLAYQTPNIMSWFDLDPPVPVADEAGRLWHTGIRHLFAVLEGLIDQDLDEYNRMRVPDLTFVLDIAFGNLERPDHSEDSWKALGRTLSGLVLPKYKFLGRAWARIAMTAVTATVNRSLILSYYSGLEQGGLERLWPMRNAIRAQLPIDQRTEARLLKGMMDSLAWGEVIRVLKTHTHKRRIGVATGDMQRDVIQRARTYRLAVQAAAAFYHFFWTAARGNSASPVGKTAAHLNRIMKRTHCDFEWKRELERYHWK